MHRVFVYLYPIKDYTDIFLSHEDKLYDEWNVDRPLPILNSAINKRYREKGYQVVFALYPDRELYGIEKKENDKIVYTDITFGEASAYDENGKLKSDFVPKYPNEEYLLQQLGDVDELVVGGYHFKDCVRRVAEAAMQKGIDSLVDLDLTDLFFNVYRQKGYFDEESYSPDKFKTYMLTRYGKNNIELAERFFNRNYSSPVYGYYKEDTEKNGCCITLSRVRNDK